MNSKSQRQFRLKTFFEDERELNVLVRSLARKLLKEKKTELPVAVLASISGVSEERWVEVYSHSNAFLEDIIVPVLDEADQELELLGDEERNFLDKIRHLLLIIYKINYSYPEIMILFHRLGLEGKNKQLKTGDYMTELKQRTFKILQDQTVLEGIAERSGTMERLLLFLIEQLLMTAQNQMFDFCEQYVETRDLSVFPDDEEWAEELMAPISEQLNGITAV